MSDEFLPAQLRQRINAGEVDVTIEDGDNLPRPIYRGMVIISVNRPINAELYRDSGGDPDDRSPSCDCCDLDLGTEDVIEVTEQTAPLLEVLHTTVLLGIDAQDLLRDLDQMISAEPGFPMGLHHGKHWLRQAQPMIAGAAHELRQHLKKEITHGDPA